MHRDFGTVVSITALVPFVISSYPLLPSRAHLPRTTSPVTHPDHSTTITKPFSLFLFPYPSPSTFIPNSHPSLTGSVSTG